MIPAETLKATVAATGIPCDGIKCFDVDYSLPDARYIRKLGERYRDFLFSLGVKYANERMDCDNFAALAACLAKLDHGRHFLGNTGLAVGHAAIVTDTLLHVVVVAVHDEAGKLSVRFYEAIPEGALCLNEFSLPVRRLLSVFF